MTISVKLTESFSAINKKINHVLSKELNKRITKNTRQATRMFMAAIPIWIRQQPEIQSLLAHGTPGSLNAQFGLSPGSASGSAAPLRWPPGTRPQLRLRGRAVVLESTIG